jgi:hypothetical protein
MSGICLLWAKPRKNHLVPGLGEPEGSTERRRLNELELVHTPPAPLVSTSRPFAGNCGQIACLNRVVDAICTQLPSYQPVGILQSAGRCARFGTSCWQPPAARCPATGCRYGVAVQPMPGCESEQLHQCPGLAQPPAVGHRLSVDRDGEPTQQRDVNLHCREGHVHRRIFPRSD